MSIIGIYLAAGKSKRFGKNKLLSPVGDYPLGSLALKTALDSRLDKIVVVTNEMDQLEWIHPELLRNYQKMLFHSACPKSKLGQSYSLQCGLRHAQQFEADAVIVLLADQPLITRDMIDKIVIKYEQRRKGQNPASFIAAKYLDVSCPPILFSDQMFEALYRLQGDKGARYLIQNKINEGIFIDFAHPKYFFDVDTKEDYMTLLQISNSM